MAISLIVARLRRFNFVPKKKCLPIG